ncbi:MAG: hypothetical protein PHG66_03945 [Candidatus Colwellbacteria bacterium]|nr:hypothetical protein [Candidatus Colwellbacteria bacterium]
MACQDPSISEGSFLFLAFPVYIFPMETKFTADSTLSEITAIEGSLEVLTKHNVPCPHCPMAAMEMDHLSIGMICEAYGLDLAGILTDLNG